MEKTKLAGNVEPIMIKSSHLMSCSCTVVMLFLMQFPVLIILLISVACKLQGEHSGGDNETHEGDSSDGDHDSTGGGGQSSGDDTHGSEDDSDGDDSHRNDHDDNDDSDEATSGDDSGNDDDNDRDEPGNGDDAGADDSGEEDNDDDEKEEEEDDDNDSGDEPGGDGGDDASSGAEVIDNENDDARPFAEEDEEDAIPVCVIPPGVSPTALGGGTQICRLRHDWCYANAGGVEWAHQHVHEATTMLAQAVHNRLRLEPGVPNDFTVEFQTDPEEDEDN